DTYAYVDGTMAEMRAAINPDDPTGTKYMDIVTNAMPAYFHEIANSSMSLVRGLLSVDDPSTYERIFTSIDPVQVVLVSGEEDNASAAGGSGHGEANWAGFGETGGVHRREELRFATPVFAPAVYRFSMPGTGAADLVVRIGGEPTGDLWDCRPSGGG